MPITKEAAKRLLSEAKQLGIKHSLLNTNPDNMSGQQFDSLSVLIRQAKANKLKAENKTKDSIFSAASGISQEEINNDPTLTYAQKTSTNGGGDFQNDSNSIKEVPDGLNALDYILGAAGAITAVNTGATINNYKRLKRFDDAMIARGLKNGVTGEKVYKARGKWNKLGVSIADASKNTLGIGKTKMPTYKMNPNFDKSNPFVSTIVEGEGPIVRNEKVYRKGKLRVGENIVKTADLFKKRKDVTVFPKDTKSTSVKNNIDNPKDMVVEKPIVETSTKKVYQLGDGKTGLLELPEGKSSSNPRFIYNEKGQLIKNPKWKPADVNPNIIPESRRLPEPKITIQKYPPNFVSNPEGIVYDPNVPKIDVKKVRSGKLGFGFDPTSKPAIKVYKGVGKIARSLLNNAVPIASAITYGANEQESVDKYGVGAKAVVDNAINTTVDMVNPLNYIRMATAPTDIAGYVFKNTVLGDVANTVSGGMNKGIDFVENQVSNTFDKKLQEERDVRSNIENKKMYKKMKETPDFDGSDLLKAVIYGNTKKSGSDALDKISGSTGIPRDVLISNAKKMWKKNKK